MYLHLLMVTIQKAIVCKKFELPLFNIPKLGTKLGLVWDGGTRMRHTQGLY